MTSPLAATQRAIVEGLRAPGGDGVYRTLVRRGLSGMLRFQLPRTAARLGPRWDADVARFLDARLPRSRYLRDVGFELFAHVEAAWRADAEVPPYVVDLARHELLAFEVANAPDDPETAATPALALDRPVRLSASARIVRYAHAVQLLSEDEGSRELPAAGPVALCAYRDRAHEIRQLSLTPSAAAILEGLAAGATLGDAVANAAAASAQALDEAFLRGAATLLEDLTERGVVRGSIGVPRADDG